MHIIYFKYAVRLDNNNKKMYKHLFRDNLTLTKTNNIIISYTITAV